MNVMGNSQQISRRSSAPVDWSHEQRIIHGKHVTQPANSSVEDYQLRNNDDQFKHTRRSVDDRVVKVQIADDEFSNVHARSLPRRSSWPSDNVNRYFSDNYFTDGQLPCIYVDRLLNQNRSSHRDVQDDTCRDTRLADCDEGTVNSDNTPVSSPRYTNTQEVCLPVETCQGVMQHDGDESDPVDDLFVSTFSNDDDNSNDDTLSGHSLDDDRQSVSDDDDDDDDDDDLSLIHI